MKSIEHGMVIMDSGQVQRYHTVPFMTKQSIGNHCWGVCNMILYIFPEASRELLMSALWHDSPEIDTGDVPSPFKNSSPEIKELYDKHEDGWHSEYETFRHLAPHEQDLLKLADALEGAWYTMNRYKNGEQTALPICKKYLSYVENIIYIGFEQLEYSNRFKRSEEIYHYIAKEIGHEC